ncbi:MAG: tetratricopeptide repeat protein [Gemmatimonadaceae bacterium]|nr:tetratricopeptide repeat protein [Gemmatimonadaceae bacterium]
MSPAGANARIDELKKRYEENPRRFFAPLANEYRKSGDLAAAIDLCRMHLEEQPQHMSGHIVYGQALYENGEYDAARTTFETALALDPENLIALRHLGDIARRNDDRAQATSWYSRVLEADPRNEEILAIIAELAGPKEEAAPPPVIAVGVGRASTSVAPPDYAAMDVPPIEPIREVAAHAPTPVMNDAVVEPPSAARPSIGLMDLSLDLDAFDAGSALGATPTPEPATADIGSQIDASAFSGFGDVALSEPTTESFAEPSTFGDVPVAGEPTTFGDVPLLDEGMTFDAPPELSAPSSAGFDLPMLDVDTPTAPMLGATPEDDTALAPPPLEFEEGLGAPELPADAATFATAASETDVPELMVEPEMEPPAAVLPPVVEPPSIGRASVTMQIPALVGLPVVGDHAIPDEPEPEPAASASGEPIVTVSMAELYAAQGHVERARDIYRHLLLERPGDVALTAALRALEPAPAPADDSLLEAALGFTELGADLGPMTPPPPIPAARHEEPEPVTAPQGPSAREIFAAIAMRDLAGGASVPVVEPTHEPPSQIIEFTSGGAPTFIEPSTTPGPLVPAVDVSVGGPLDTLFAGRGVSTDDESAARLLAMITVEGAGIEPVAPTGRPTQPAAGELSLSSVFGESRANERVARQSQKLRFDQFFSADAPASAPTNAPAPPPADAGGDDAQFNDWLSGLKGT